MILLLCCLVTVIMKALLYLFSDVCIQDTQNQSVIASNRMFVVDDEEGTVYCLPLGFKPSLLDRYTVGGAVILPNGGYLRWDQKLRTT